MGAKVVHHHHLPLAQRGGEDPLYVGLEDSGGGSAFDGHGWSHPLHAHAGEHGGVPAAISGHRAVGPLSLLGPPVYRRKRCVGAHLVYENQGAGIERSGDRHPPGGPSPLVSFQRPHSPFFRLKPIRFRSLLKELARRLVRYGGPSASLPWGKRLPSVGEFGVTLDRGEADGEQAGGLGLGRATLLDSLDYFLA